MADAQEEASRARAKEASPSLRVGEHESALRSVSRRISQVFKKVVGKPDAATAHAEPSETDSADLSMDISSHFVEQHVPPHPRAVSTTRKASVDFSLLRQQTGLRAPAHLIIEAYREALKARAEEAKIFGPVPNTLLPGASGSTTIRDRDAPALVSIATPHRARAPTRMAKPSSGRVRKQAQKPLKHRIQLITKPMVDLSKVPEDRKHRPGFITANFDVSDDESEDDIKGADVPETVLHKRPQIESVRLKQSPSTSKPGAEASKASSGALSNLAGDGQSKPSVAFGSSASTGQTNAVSSKTAEPSKQFQFGPKPSSADPVSGPFALSSSQQSNLDKFPTSHEPAVKFSFGAGINGQQNAATTTTAPSGQQNAATIAPFTFGAPKTQATPNQLPEAGGPGQAAAGAEQPAAAPKFSFGGLSSSTPASKSSDLFPEKASATEAQPQASLQNGGLFGKPTAPLFNVSRDAAASNDQQAAPLRAEGPEAKKPFSFGTSLGQNAKDDEAAGAKRSSFEFRPDTAGPAKRPASGAPQGAPVFSFGGTAGGEPSKPFVFGQPAQPPAPKGVDPVSSTNAAGNVNATSSDAAPKPSFSFGGPSTQPAATSAATSAAASAAASAASSQPANAASSLFGATTSTAAPTSNAPKESLTGSTSSKPAFNFGSSATTPNPANELGKAQGASAPATAATTLFGGASAGAAAGTGAATGTGAGTGGGMLAAAANLAEANPASSKASTPAFSFGSSNTAPAAPAPLNTATTDPRPGSEAPSKAPAFSFGAPGGNGQPSFGGFGAKSATPGISFGAPKEANGASTTSGKAASQPPPQSTSSQQPFTFGNPSAAPQQFVFGASTSGAPAFGQNAASTNPGFGASAPANPFSFGSSGTNFAPGGMNSANAPPTQGFSGQAPAFSFGGAAQLGSQFPGSSAPSPMPAGSRETTPGVAGSTVPGRKIAQVKRRLRRN